MCGDSPAEFAPEAGGGPGRGRRCPGPGRTRSAPQIGASRRSSGTSGPRPCSHLGVPVSAAWTSRWGRSMACPLPGRRRPRRRWRGTFPRTGSVRRTWPAPHPSPRHAAGGTSPGPRHIHGGGSPPPPRQGPSQLRYRGTGPPARPAAPRPGQRPRHRLRRASPHPPQRTRPRRPRSACAAAP